MACPITSDLEQAASVLRRGGLVAFPTETVYGLGADAQNPRAVARIFAAKGRPHWHPLIVHLADPAQLDAWATDVPASARHLAEEFWPGPLTMILKRAARALDAVTGGQDTVGLRVPSHPVARELLARFGDGVAAPSANRFGRVSPTSAEHVLCELGDELDLIVEGGDSTVGLESTIVDCSGGTPAILRPGGVTQEMLEGVLGRPVALRTASPHQANGVRAPGLLESHYAPRAQVVLASDPMDAARRARELRASGFAVGLLTTESVTVPEGVTLLDLGTSLEDAARLLYARLREADRKELSVIVAVLPQETGIGRAIADRLRRAAVGREPASEANR